MPGIVGLITRMPCEQAEAQLGVMLKDIRHEPNYATGTWTDESLGIYVGWAARKGSFADPMPVRNEEGNWVLVFSGEEFPNPDLFQTFRKRGHQFEDAGASYLVHFAEEDKQFPAGLNGRFHGLLVDRDRGTTKLFNDRYGMHRIYYHESKGAFYFAAESKAILAVRPELRSVDARGLGEFVSCGCVLENRTLFRDIYALPPASSWTFQNAAIQNKGNYFQPQEWEEQTQLEPEAYYQELKSTFAEILPRYFNGLERIGMSLTGGLDTRMIMAWRKSSPGSLPCYSFGGMFRDCQDVVIARRIAQACGQTHGVIPVGQEFLSQFPHYSERSVYLTDGAIDVSHSADLYINERAAKIAPVRMTGNYGGEVLRRVRAFKPVDPAPGLFTSELLTHVASAKTTYKGLLQGHPLSFTAFKQAPWHHYGLLSLEQTQISLRSPFLDNQFVKTVFRAPESCVDNTVSLRLIADGDPKLGKIRTDRGLKAGNTGLWTSTLQNFIEFTAKAEYAYDYGMPQGVARVDHALSALHLERLFLGRHKFYHFRVWYRDALSRHVQEILLDPRTLSRPYIQKNSLESMVRRHVSGTHNYTTEIHKVLTLELLHRLFIDSK